MGHDLYIHGIEPVTDEKKLQLMAVRKACKAARIFEPNEVSKVLDSDKMCERGKVINIDIEEFTESGGDCCQYIDVKTLPHGVKWIRLLHSY